MKTRAQALVLVLLLVSSCGDSSKSEDTGQGAGGGSAGAQGVSGGAGTAGTAGSGGSVPLPIPKECNGRVELCSRRFDQIAFPATHNAMSNQDEKWVVPNQNHGIARQLDDGIRALLIDTHPYEDDVYLCHGTCKFGNILLVDALTVLRKFLDTHRGEVLTLIIEDGITPEQTVKAFEASGLVKYVFTHHANDAWPTLREMIDADTRLFVTAENEGPPPDWYHHVWDYTWDTPYTYDSKEKIEKTGCDVNRGKKGSPLFLLNHWIGTPVSLIENAMVANQYDVLSGHTKACQTKLGRIPSFVAVDFYDVGALFQVVNELNGL